MKLLEILILIVPAVVYALWNGRNGVNHPAIKQVIIVSAIIGIVQLCQFSFPHEYSLLMYVKGVLVSITGYALIFPYAFNWYWFNKQYSNTDLEHGNRLSYILNHLSKTAIPDKWFIKYKISWQVRLIGYLVLFIASIVWFIQ